MSYGDKPQTDRNERHLFKNNGKPTECIESRENASRPRGAVVAGEHHRDGFVLLELKRKYQ